jgi:hypothetical protein
MENFKSGDQFSIIEDMPRKKPIRFEMNHLAGEKNGRKYDFDAKTNLIRITKNGYEADLELKPRDVPMFAILCPMGLENFKGATFVFDGYNWAYLGIETSNSNQPPISQVSQAMRDPRQPDLNAPVDQITKNLETMVADITKMYAVNSPEYKIDIKILTNVANSILPGKALDLISAAKAQGYIFEQDGAYKPT